MKILALEFSSKLRSAAVADARNGEFHALSNVSDERGGSAHTGMELTDSALRQAGVTPSQIQLLAVGLGPGSYAGIRSAIALCQGWQLARETPRVGIPSTEVIAAEALRAGIRGTVQILVDAQRGEFYRTVCFIEANSISPLAPLEIVSAARVTNQGVTIGPDVSQAVSGALPVFPTAIELARLAAGRSKSHQGEQLEPIYLRPTTFLKAAPPRFIER